MSIELLHYTHPQETAPSQQLPQEILEAAAMNGWDLEPKQRSCLHHFVESVQSAIDKGMPFAEIARSLIPQEQEYIRQRDKAYGDPPWYGKIPHRLAHAKTTLAIFFVWGALHQAFPNLVSNPLDLLSFIAPLSISFKDNVSGTSTPEQRHGEGYYGNMDARDVYRASQASKGKDPDDTYNL